MLGLVRLRAVLGRVLRTARFISLDTTTAHVKGKIPPDFFSTELILMGLRQICLISCESIRMGLEI